MSDEWPDDDERFTGPKCRLDKVGGVASGEFTKPQRTARKYYAVCELVPTRITDAALNTYSASDRNDVRIVQDYEDENLAEMMARKHAVAVANKDGVVVTVAVIPVWRVK